MNILDAKQLLDRARVAQAGWARKSSRERSRSLSRMRSELTAGREDLVHSIVRDTGKPPLDALGGDVLVTLEHMRFYERNASRLLKPRRVGGSWLFFRRCRFTEYLEPHGVALIFGPANYPLQLSLVPAVTALHAGNAVVLKVSERTPLVARAIEDLVRRSGMPDHLLQVVDTAAEEAQILIEAKPDFVFFTGSTTNGGAVSAAAAAHGIPSLLELGGSDPAIVFADCDFDRTVEGVLYGAFSNAGQVCVGVKRLYVEQRLYERFVGQIVRRAAELRAGDGPDCDLGDFAKSPLKSRFDAQIQDALEHGARLESRRAAATPVVLSGVPPEAQLMREEAFGPVLCVRPFVDEEEAVRLANATPFALGASVWTNDLRRGRRIAARIKAGVCSVNDVIRNIANPEAAFGGNGASGHGRYHGVHGLQAFSRVKTVMESSSSKTREVNWFPLTQRKYAGLSSLIAWRHSSRGPWSLFRGGLHLCALFGMLLIALPMSAQAAHLILQVHLPEGARGPIAYLVFSSPDGFPQDKSKARMHGFTQPVQNERVKTIDVGEMPPGRYAVSAYLDENGNGKLDSGLMGIPKEPVGVSNNPPHRMGPPRFQDAAFNMGTSTQTISVDLVRP